MASATTNGKDIFPFFELPRELRDAIYEACDGKQPVKHKNGPSQIPPEKRTSRQQQKWDRMAKQQEKAKFKQGNAYVEP